MIGKEPTRHCPDDRTVLNKNIRGGGIAFQNLITNESAVIESLRRISRRTLSPVSVRQDPHRQPRASRTDYNDCEHSQHGCGDSVTTPPGDVRDNIHDLFPPFFLVLTQYSFFNVILGLALYRMSDAGLERYQRY
jgi:hypothetical protein